jgi:hypothetical protein
MTDPPRVKVYRPFERCRLGLVTSTGVLSVPELLQVVSLVFGVSAAATVQGTHATTSGQHTREILVKKITLAAMRLPLAAQRILAKDRGTECRSALAASPFTDSSILATLTRDRVPGVRRFAFLRTDDIEALTSELSRGKPGISTPYAARNPLAPKELLTKALTSQNEQTSLGAYVNPATPEDDRRKLTPERATEIVAVGGSNHDRVVRAHELAANNPWMLERAGDWNGDVRRALAGLPQATEEHLKAITLAGRAGSVAVRRHPLRRTEFNDRSVDAWSALELTTLGGPALDMLAMGRDDFDTEAARSIVNRRGDCEAEPHVIGRIINRFGPEALEYDTIPAMILWSGTRFNAARWVAPIMGFLVFNMPVEWSSLRPAVESLGPDANAWEMFLQLIDESWQGTADEASEAAFNLLR